MLQMIFSILRGESPPGGNLGETPKNDLSPPVLGKNPVLAEGPTPPPVLVGEEMDQRGGRSSLPPAWAGGEPRNMVAEVGSVGFANRNLFVENCPTNRNLTEILKPITEPHCHHVRKFSESVDLEFSFEQNFADQSKESLDDSDETVCMHPLNQSLNLHLFNSESSQHPQTSQSQSPVCFQSQSSEFSSEKSGDSPVNLIPVRMITARGEDSQPEGENQLVQWAEFPPPYQSDCETEGEGEDHSQLRQMEDLLIAAGWVPPRNQDFGQSLPNFSANFELQIPQLHSQFGNLCPEFGTQIPQIEGSDPVLLLEDRFSANHRLTASEGMLISVQPAPENLTAAVLTAESSNQGGPAQLLNLAGSSMEIGDEEMEPEVPVFQPPVFGPQPPPIRLPNDGGGCEP